VKACVVILCAGADVGCDELDGLTPLQSAAMDSARELARSGRVGLVRSVPGGAMVGAGVCALTLLGRDPNEARVGEAVLVALGSGVGIEPGEWVFVLDLVCVQREDECGGVGGERIRDAWVGELPDDEGKALIGALMKHWSEQAPELVERMGYVHVGAGRAVVFDRSGMDWSSVETIDPGELHDLSWGSALPKGAWAEAKALRTLTELGREFLESCEINLAREEQGLRRADLGWLWGQGRLGGRSTTWQTHGVGGAMICDSALGSGIGSVLGLEPVLVERGDEASDAHHARMGSRVVGSIRANALTCVHASAPAHSSMRGDALGKARALESIDRGIVKPALEALRSSGEPWRMLIVPDRVHASVHRRSVDALVPFAMGGTDVVHVVERELSEIDGADSDLRVEHGDELLEFVLRSGLSGARDA